MADDGAALYHFTHRLGKVFRTLDAASRVPPAQLSALVTVAMHGPLPMGELARFELLAPQTVTRLVDDLETQRLVTRAPSETDRRRVVVAVTRRGRSIALAARQRKIDHVEALLATLPAGHRRSVRAALDVLVAALDEPNRR